MNRCSSTGSPHAPRKLIAAVAVTLCFIVFHQETGAKTHPERNDASQSSQSKLQTPADCNKSQEGDSDEVAQKQVFYSSSEKRRRARDLIAKNDSNWRLQYCEEQSEGFDMRVLEDSIDERAANTLHTAMSIHVSNAEYYKFNSGDPDVDRATMDSVAGPQVDQLRCRRDLIAMNKLVTDLKLRLREMRNQSRSALDLREEHFRLARVLESYGRYEPGLLSGRTHFVGQQDQCTSTNLLLPKRARDGQERLEKVGTRFCWANLNMEKHLNEDLKYRTKDSFDPERDQLYMSLCLPESCHAKTFEGNRKLVQDLIDSQLRMPRMLYLDEHLAADSIFCAPDLESGHGRIPFSGKLLLAFLSGWLILVIYATAIFRPSAKAANQTMTVFMDCLNFRQSFMDLTGGRAHPEAELQKLDSKREVPRVDLSALNPIKVFGSAFVVMGHSLVFYFIMTQNGPRAFNMIKFDPGVVLMLLGTFVVDSFFVITGLLMAYFVMKHAHKSRRNTGAETGRSKIMEGAEGEAEKASEVMLFFKFWFMFALKRHLQLVPMLYLVFWFKKSVTTNYFSDKPLWDNGFNKETTFGACHQESWLSPLIMSAAALPMSKECLSQSWSISADLFFSIIIPPVLLLMSTRPKLAFSLGTAITLISLAWTALTYSRIDPMYKAHLESASPYGSRLALGSVGYIYTYPHYRVCTVMIGLLAGYCLFVYEKKVCSDSEWTWPSQVHLATKIASSTLVSLLTSFVCMSLAGDYAQPIAAYAAANMYTTIRVQWAASNAVLFLRMVSDWRNSFLMRFFANGFWNSLAKLSYCILLIHLEVLICMTIVPGAFGYFEKVAIIRNFGASHFYCVLLSCFLYVFYENPFSKLTKRLIIPKCQDLLS